MYRNLNASCTPCASMVACNATAGNTVAAGTVCTSEVCGPNMLLNCSSEPLAQINFPIQQYAAGFCPGEALERGTMFPELVL